MSNNINNNRYPGNGYANGSFHPQESPGNTPKKESDEIDLKQLFFTLWHNKWIISGAVALFGGLALMLAYTATPIYQSEGTMMITQQQNRFTNAESNIAGLLSSTYGVGVGSTISNELQVMQSRRLSEELADSLLSRRLMNNGRQYPVLFKEYPEDSSMVARDTVAQRLRNNLSFSQVDREGDIVSINYQSPSSQEASDVVNLTMDIYTDMSTRRNRRSAGSAITFLESELEKIQDRLNVAEEQLRDFMDREKLVQVDAQTEKLIERMAEMESKRQEARVGLVAVNAGMEQYEEQLNDIKPGLSEQYADAIGPNMMRLQYQLAEFEIERMRILANNPSMRDDPNPPAKLQEIEEKIEIYRERIRELTDDLIADGDEYLGFLGGSDGNIAESVTDLNRKLIELRVEGQQYESQIEVIDEQLAGQHAFFNQLPDNMIELARLERDVTINEELYLTVSEQYSEMSLWEQTQFGLGRQVDEGFVPAEPIKPNKKLYLLAGFLLGGLLSVGFIFGREMFNNSIDGVEKIRRFGFPLLAVIPRMDPYISGTRKDSDKVMRNGHKLSPHLITVHDSISPVSESFRRLESNIVYSNPDRKIRTLMVTSSGKGEGKTTVSSNLGVVLAEAGYKVCIADTDLRRPNLHNQFGLSQSPGIVELLFDDLKPENVIKETVQPGLHIVSSGRCPPNPSAITQSRAFLGFIDGLKKEYDFVIVDTAPFGIITDASALVGKTDGVVVVTRFGSTSEEELEHTLEHLERLNADILGLVFSSFNQSESTDYYYGARYSSYYNNVYEEYSSYHND